MAAVSAIERSLPPGDRNEVAAEEPKPDVMLGFGFSLVSVSEALSQASGCTVGTAEALQARSLSLLKVATAELVEMTARAHALAAHLDQQIARHLARQPRVRS